MTRDASMVPVAITGMSVVSPFGSSCDVFARRMFAGESGISAIRGSWVPRDFPVSCAGLLPRPFRRTPLHDLLEPDHLTPFVTVSLDLLDQLLPAIPKNEPVDGLVFGTGEGPGFLLGEHLLKRGIAFDPGRFDVRTEDASTRMAEVLARCAQVHIPQDQVIPAYNACASGNMALGTALDRIRSGTWRRAIAGALDLRCEAPYLMSLQILGVLSVSEQAPEKVSSPFSRHRSGYVKSEGGALFLLERLEDAVRRGAVIHGILSGYGASADAWNMTDGRPDLKCVTHAMRAAIADAGLGPEEIQAINAHGTSTLLNDLLEAKAIHEVFGARASAIPVSSNKSQIGHAAIGCGAVEAVACIAMLQEQRLMPTLNLEEPDPDCDLDCVPFASRPAVIRHVLSNSFGFGGQNACLVLSRA